MKIVFMGSAEFGIPALEMLLGRHEVAAVVSTPARPRGRGLKLFDSPVAEFAKSRGIDDVLTPEDLSDPGFINKLTSFNADLFVVVAFRILPRGVFAIPRFGTVNIHASLLPRYRGAAPIHRAIEAGERETGVTVFRIDDGVDTGEIILQKKLPIGDMETTPELYERLSRLGVEALAESLDMLTGGNELTSIQNSAEATRAPKLSRQEGHIDWKLPAAAIYNKIRAFKPFPGTYFFVGGKRINVEWGIPVDVVGAAAPGRPLFPDDGNQAPDNWRGDGNLPLAAGYPQISAGQPGAVLTAKGDSIDVRCGSGVLRITKVKPEGRPSMDVRAFLLGHTINEGAVLE